MAKEVITVTMDKEFYELLMANAPQGGGGVRSIIVKTKGFWSGEVLKETVMEIPADATYWGDFVIYNIQPETAGFYQGRNCEDEDDPTTCYETVLFYDGKNDITDLKGSNGIVKLNDPIYFDEEYSIYVDA